MVLIINFSNSLQNKDVEEIVRISGLQNTEIHHKLYDGNFMVEELVDLMSRSDISKILLLNLHHEHKFVAGWGKRFFEKSGENEGFGIIGLKGTKYVNEQGDFSAVEAEVVTADSFARVSWWKKLIYSKSPPKDVIAVDWPVVLIDKEKLALTAKFGLVSIKLLALWLSFQSYCSGVRVGVISSENILEKSSITAEGPKAVERECLIRENLKSIPQLFQEPLLRKNSLDPLVTVVIPVYNYGLRLEAMFQSVFNQTFKQLEIIVVDDGSTDNYVRAKLSALAQAGCIKLITQTNSGPSAARNRGIKESLGEYILPLDADDEINPDYLEKCVAALKADSRLSPVYCDTIHAGEMDLVEARPEWSEELLKSGPFIVNCSMFRREAFDKAGGYDTELKGWEDYDLWLRMMLNGYVGLRIPEPLFTYYHHESDGTVSTQANENQEALHHKILKKNGLMD